MTSRPYRILIVGPSWVGDTVMSQCLLKLLKQRHPHCTIDVLAPEWTFPLLSRMPEVSQSIPFPIQHGELKLRERYQIGKALRAHHYDQAIVLPNSFKSALIPWFARIPKRTGWLGESRYVVLNDARRLDKKRYPRMVDQYIALGQEADSVMPETYPLPSFSVNQSSALKLVDRLGLPWTGQSVFALCAGAEFGPSKRWPEEYYAKVANQLLDRGYHVWLFGSPKDRAVTDKIMTLTDERCENLAGRLQLFETIDLLSLVQGVVTNDSGLLHVACALEKPTVAIYGSTSPDFTPPLSDTATVLKLSLDCQPCFQRVCPLIHHRCMRDITPDRVLSIVSAWSV